MKVVIIAKRAKRKEPERTESGNNSLAFGNPILSVSSPYLNLTSHELGPVWRTKGREPPH